MRCVILPGAGASASFGVPTLRHVFTDVRARQYLRTDTVLKKALSLSVFWTRRGLTVDTSAKDIDDALQAIRSRVSAMGQEP